ncbi:hypothetical protein L7F22_037588 [Adiantum nelumboides]|nr:hypothetical protein [Adiantum nelumboides]
MVEKSCTLHAFCGHNRQDATAIATRPLACFCYACMNHSWNRCTNKSHVQPWDYHILMPLSDEDENEEDTPTDDALEGQIIGYDKFVYEGQHDALSSALCVGDTFAANPDATTNDENVNFYWIKCIVVKEKAK